MCSDLGPTYCLGSSQVQCFWALLTPRAGPRKLINLFLKHLTQGLSTLESQVGSLSKRTKQQQNDGEKRA